MVTACKKNNLTLKKKKKIERDTETEVHSQHRFIIQTWPFFFLFLFKSGTCMNFVRQAVWLAPSAKKKKKRRGEELVEVPQTILVLALFLFSIIEMNWILRAEKECGVGGSCGVRILLVFVFRALFLDKMERTWETDIKEQVHCEWVRVWERDRESAWVFA